MALGVVMEFVLGKICLSLMTRESHICMRKNLFTHMSLSSCSDKSL